MWSYMYTLEHDPSNRISTIGKVVEHYEVNLHENLGGTMIISNLIVAGDSGNKDEAPDESPDGQRSPRHGALLDIAYEDD